MGDSVLEKVRIEKWLLEVDTEKTRELYKKGVDVCDCLYCKNFVESCKYINPSVNKLLKKLEINPTMPAHLTPFEMEETMTMPYAGHYHISGRVLEGELVTPTTWNESNTVEIGNFTFGFSNELEFLPKNFPSPILQIDFVADIPWIIEENPDDI